MLAGMGGVSYSALYAAVSNAGGLRLSRRVDDVARRNSRDEIAPRRKSLTSRPFGVDLLTAFPETLSSNVELLIEGGASAFVAGLGVPRTVIDLCHAHGVLVISMCGKVEHAQRALDAGCDVVVAQGTEAGGHTGTVATMPLVPMIVDAVGGAIPVVAAGGHLRRARTRGRARAGADGVWIGTRFIATPEARALPGYRERILEAREDGTVISRAFTGKTMRVMKNETTERYEAEPASLKTFPDQLAVAHDEARFTSAATRRRRASTLGARATPPARPWERSTRSSRRANSCGASSTKPRRRCNDSRNNAEGCPFVVEEFGDFARSLDSSRAPHDLCRTSD